MASLERIDVVVPVHGEEPILDANVHRLHTFLTESLDLSWRIVIAENGSKDRSWEIASRLTHELKDVVALKLIESGRGRALRRAWSQSEATTLAYLDADLSADLAGFPALVEPLLRGEADLSTGNRHSPASNVERGAKRELLSRVYSGLTAKVLGMSVQDPQCGFKALTARAAQLLLPKVRDNGWFFDTELIWWADRLGMTVNELPIDWCERTPSSVRILPTVMTDLAGLARLAGTRRY